MAFPYAKFVVIGEAHPNVDADECFRVEPSVQLRRITVRDPDGTRREVQAVAAEAGDWIDLQLAPAES